MGDSPGARHHTAAIITACHLGLAPQQLKGQVLTRLRRVVPVDAVWWATCDPATLLFTQAYRDGIPERTTPYFIGNEFLADDVNKWAELARDPGGVRSLAQATGGDLEASPRYREVFAPLGMADELRAVLRAGGACWGLMCLHRETGRLFTGWEARYLRMLAPHLAEGMRAGLLAAAADDAATPDAPGLVVLDPAGDVIAITEPARAWLAELGHDRHAALPLPAEVYAVAARLRSLTKAGDPAASAPRLRVRAQSGRWAVLHAAWLQPPAEAHDDPPGQIAIIIETAAPAEVASMIMHAYRLTPQERVVTGLVCRGLSTSQIATRLCVSPYTVQDHLKSVFTKTGVRSRRELVATIFRQHYLGPASQGRPVAPSGFFT
jgi:DNA-binding CsgD family transcriptional regulator